MDSLGIAKPFILSFKLASKLILLQQRSRFHFASGGRGSILHFHFFIGVQNFSKGVNLEKIILLKEGSHLSNRAHVR